VLSLLLRKGKSLVGDINQNKRPYFLPLNHHTKIFGLTFKSSLPFPSSSSIMESSNWVLKLKCQILLSVSILLFFFLCRSMSTTFPSSHVELMVTHTKALHQNFTALSDFRLINRRILNDCSILSPYLKLDIHSNSSLSDEEFVTVTVTGVSKPRYGDWVAMISPSNSK